jgi:hypothetical protein
MANLIKVKRSAEESKVPTTAQLELGELAINTYDGRVYIKKDPGTASIVEVGSEFPEDIKRAGFVDRAQTSISFDGVNTFTLTATGSRWYYYIAGDKVTVSGNKTVTLTASPPAASGKYFISINNNKNGDLSVSTTGWDLTDHNLLPVALVRWDNSATPKFWLADERHSSLIDRRVHYYLHTTRGTAVSTFGAVSGYTVQPAVPANTDNTFAISSTKLNDEDIIVDLAPLADPNGTNTDYVVFYRTDADTWTWKASAVPYSVNGSYIQWDNAGTLTNGQSGYYYNSYLIYAVFQGAARFIIVPGRGEYTSVADAQAENPNDFNWTAFGPNEYVIAYQFTWRTSSGYTTSGLCRLESEPRKINAATQEAVVGITVAHNGTVGLQGGATDEYYHANAAQHAVLVSASNSVYKFDDVNGRLGINTLTPTERLEVNGRIKHGGLISTAGTEVDQVQTFTVSLTMSTAWQDTTINATDLATGTYIVQLYANDSAVNGGHSSEYYSGTMSWYAADTDEDSSDEIILHRAGNATGAKVLYLRTLRTVSANADDLKLQIAGSYTANGNSNYVFKFRRMI